jgi:hypothetical protein
LTSLNNIASSGVTNINGVARNDWIRTEILQRIRGIGKVANIVCASVVVVTSSIVGTLGHWASSELEC